MVGSVTADERLTDSSVRAGDILLRSKLGVPWASLALMATCLLVSFPLLVNPYRYYLTYATGYCDVNRPVVWWHYLVTPFVHGVGPDCGFPPLWFHLGVNLSLFAFQGVYFERLMGSGRYALLTLSALAVNTGLKYAIADGRAHGASGMAWSFLLFAMVLLWWLWRERGTRALGDGFALATAFLTVFGVLGLAKHWHLWNLLVSFPFFLLWRRTFVSNLGAVRDGGGVDRGRRLWNAAGVAATVGLLLFNAGVVAGAVAGWIPQSTTVWRDAD